MALQDVHEYYYTLLNQYVETKEDLVDFEEALANGYITEDKVTEIKTEILKMKENIDRIQYIMYLFALPKNKIKLEKFKAANKELEKYFLTKKADLLSIQEEQATIKEYLKTIINKLKKADSE